MCANSSTGHFRKLAHVPVYLAPHAQPTIVEAWRSTVSGLTVVHAAYENPTLVTEIYIATETFDDRGIPQAIESMISASWELYPHAGMIQDLKRDAFITEDLGVVRTEGTQFSLSSVGYEGLLRMLPVYFDCIYHPHWTEDTFQNEVYHVNSDLGDDGAMYTSAAFYEYVSKEVVERKMRHMLYPPTSGYRSTSEGIPSALRHLTLDDLRDYHRQYYVPHNTTILLGGSVDHTELFKVLHTLDEQFVESGIAHGEHGPPGWKRPFVETGSSIPPRIDGSTLQQPGVDDAMVPPDGVLSQRRRYTRVDVPTSVEDSNLVRLVYISPKCLDRVTLLAFRVLNTYLFRRHGDPLLEVYRQHTSMFGDFCDLESETYTWGSLLYIDMDDVPVERLGSIDTWLVSKLTQIAAQIDLNTMHAALASIRAYDLFALERYPGTDILSALYKYVCTSLISEEGLRAALDLFSPFDVLQAWSAEDWQRLIMDYLVTNPRLVITEYPSTQLWHEHKKETQNRVNHRKASGCKFVQTISARPQEASAVDMRVNRLIVQKFGKVANNSIVWIPVATARAGPLPPDVQPLSSPSDADQAVQAHVDQDERALPFFLQFDHVPSNFVTITLVFGTDRVPIALWSYLTLFVSTLFSHPIVHGSAGGDATHSSSGKATLDKWPARYEALVGIQTDPIHDTQKLYDHGETISIRVQVQVNQYESAVTLLRDVLWHSEFSYKCIQAEAEKRLGPHRLSSWSSSDMSQAMLHTLLYAEEKSTHLVNSWPTGAVRMSKVLAELERDPSLVLDAFQGIRSSLFQLDTLRVSVAGNILALASPKAPWLDSFCPGDWLETRGILRPLPKLYNAMRADKAALRGHARLGTIPGAGPAYATIAVQCVPGIMHPDYASLMVITTFLKECEPFWQRLQGSSSGCCNGISVKPESFWLSLTFSSSRTLDDSLKDTRKLVQDMANASAPESVRSIEADITYAQLLLHDELAGPEGTISEAKMEVAGFVNFLDTVVQGAQRGFRHDFLAAVRTVSVEDVQRSLRTYILPLFDPTQSVAAVTCTRAEAPFVQELESWGYVVDLVDIPRLP